MLSGSAAAATREKRGHSLLPARAQVLPRAVLWPAHFVALGPSVRWGDGSGGRCGDKFRDILSHPVIPEFAPANIRDPVAVWPLQNWVPDKRFAFSGMTRLERFNPAAGPFSYLPCIHRTWGRSRYRSACAEEEWRDWRRLQGSGCRLYLGKLVRRRKWKHDRQRPITSPADPVSPFGVLLGCSTSALQDGRCDEARRQRSEIFLPARRAVTLQIRSHYLLFGGAPRRLPRQASSHEATKYSLSGWSRPVRIFVRALTPRTRPPPSAHARMSPRRHGGRGGWAGSGAGRPQWLVRSLRRNRH